MIVLPPLQQNQLIMKPFLIALFSLLFYLSTSQSYCPSSFTPLYSTCTFYYYFSDPICQTFQFTECTWEECVEETTVNNDTVCTRYQTRYDTSWDYCTSSCCLKSYPFAYESLQQCQDDLKSFYATLFLVFMIIIGAVALIIVTVYLVRFIRSRKFTLRRAIGRRESLNMLGGNERLITDDNQEIAKGMNWVMQYQSEDENKICGTCFLSGCTIRLECQHVFHRQCARDFMRYGGECTICRKKCMNQIRIYCQQCKKNYFISKVDQYKQMSPHLCPNCETPGS